MLVYVRAGRSRFKFYSLSIFSDEGVPFQFDIGFFFFPSYHSSRLTASLPNSDNRTEVGPQSLLILVVRRFAFDRDFLPGICLISFSPLSLLRFFD